MLAGPVCVAAISTGLAARLDVQRHPADMAKDSWTLAELHDELKRFRRAAESAGLKPASVHTYVNRSEIFVRWLSGDFEFRGPNS